MISLECFVAPRESRNGGGISLMAGASNLSYTSNGVS